MLPADSLAPPGSGPPPPQSRLAKPHSKSDTPLGIRQLAAASDKQVMIGRLTERKDTLEKALEDALRENRRLLAEARRKRQIEAEYDDEKALTAHLAIVIEAVQGSPPRFPAPMAIPDP
jgi:hypothetical protein